MAHDEDARIRRGDLTPKEAEYQKALEGAVVKGPHIEKPLRGQWAKGGEPKRLYTLTTLSIHAMYGGERTIAICDSFEEANHIVIENMGDIWETSYGLAVVESVIANALYGGIGERDAYWYRYWGNARTGGYQPIETPECYRSIQGWGIG